MLDNSNYLCYDITLINHNNIYMNKLLKFVNYYLSIFSIFLLSSANVIAANPLQISNVNVQITQNNATISWTTNEKTDGRIDFGLTSNYGNVLIDGSANSTEHTVTLLNLNPNTTYHFKITSKSSLQEVSTFDRTFKTGKIQDIQAPIIYNVSAPYITGKTAVIKWLTDKEADSLVEYGKTINYTHKKSSAAKTTEHYIILSNLQPATTYHYNIKSKDKNGFKTLINTD